MRPFEYVRAEDRADALARIGSNARLLGGGTNLVDLLRQNVEQASALVDVSRLGGVIRETNGGGLLIDASVKNAALAAHPLVRDRYPVLSRALLAGASAQIRNMATVGGNILQRTRCMYFYDVDGARCNKRQRGAGCDAIGGFNRYHAILGASEQCVATHPSDMCVALAMLDAVIHLSGPDGERSSPLTEFHLLPNATPQVETVLKPGELIVGVELPPPSNAVTRSEYRKVRDRSSYAFALISVAGGLALAGGRISEARIALGGVAAKPWRATRAEAALIGVAPTNDAFLAAIREELTGAQALSGNEFKIGLVERTVVAVLAALAGAR
ncbi:xanthine dehydrogenase YagS FAD-binding subunit [Agrobacterium tumefaciens]|uniref:Xanthine dehydrogenase YagS FAD-binding subunit n=1 Tax=Agrobacterium radiobacter TaxID=362 RepID=A0ABR6JCA9_AGRRD|nr:MULTISPECIES: xanthine dehydrogenase family protein subunit M [Agrobacterium tumefaciens complex]MBB4320510.1 xanthine dehydrogenase YagS FAD-binding subunit [Agrobacterium radiobacter]MBB4337175.1 xanthine dehydrogenase YagS FAD-binding subunit [Agrobacterium radiobacter]MBB4492577.1 xanthine dehydrogenase YagS FAD-binding subunit [Agrobacterium radiobacter]MBB4497475.1 xanthine dehydrogenase YagS FAD-binding subunit [Agrobacterium radiobacter]MBB4502614.1 xanthine dehydrogenase YagS FAD-b